MSEAVVTGLIKYVTIKDLLDLMDSFTVVTDPGGSRLTHSTPYQRYP